ncbi:hypothetical protein M2451_002756 [Dysgonomonas sp. PFB1-18]|uniref:hypothetical protein n=1 Tax=unclassified Dysgonomonas TaxID=2630389 RepID=UPI0024759185|nr:MULTISPECIES: hypothetical protein [unclassified Dysgonomonas]MDH6309358.1 hypothetical protein [Dysgonomonas sp. PF1-14]MDH6339777.1 hypothetical protein [Dysgonomonas sp. PF1-16]MDH6381425.1 hypothetical protein [Dysgonomonas sp. PFB1-18]MDH6398640.1 hypothetical protein [Dysgonomonas sp. PF1-23]
MRRTKIQDTLTEAIPALLTLQDDFFIIGASAAILSGIEIGDTGDIDILSSTADAQRLKQLWDEKMVTNPQMKESHLFRSDFARYSFSLMDIEVMGDLYLCSEGAWKKIEVQEYTCFGIDGLQIKVPTIAEQIRILDLFGRPKDQQRREIIVNSKV